MVDKGAGTAGADPVHPLFRSGAEVHDFGVFPAQLHHGVGLGDQLLHRRSRRNDFLHEGQLQPLGDTHAGGTGKGKTEPGRTHHVLQGGQVRH